MWNAADFWHLKNKMCELENLLQAVVVSSLHPPCLSVVTLLTLPLSSLHLHCFPKAPVISTPPEPQYFSSKSNLSLLVDLSGRPLLPAEPNQGAVQLHRSSDPIVHAPLSWCSLLYLLMMLGCFLSLFVLADLYRVAQPQYFPDFHPAELLDLADNESDCF